MDESDERQELHPAIRGLKAVCRCNNIKYRTIERAIRRGACTISQIALCTTATTGHCGGSCTPDVQAMLEELGPKSGLSDVRQRAAGVPAGEPPALRSAALRPSAPHPNAASPSAQQSASLAEQTKPVPADAWWIRKP